MPKTKRKHNLLQEQKQRMRTGAHRVTARAETLCLRIRRQLRGQVRIKTRARRMRAPGCRDPHYIRRHKSNLRSYVQPEVQKIAIS